MIAILNIEVYAQNTEVRGAKSSKIIQVIDKAWFKGLISMVKNFYRLKDSSPTYILEND
jgi:Ni,Fe-hydrogenase I cytochrome b subunit